jgi:response regulator NasT
VRDDEAEDGAAHPAEHQTERRTEGQASPRTPTPADVAAARQVVASAPSAAPGVPVAPQAPGRPRVVIAEDEALIRLDLRETLEELGYDVVGEAGDGERAIALAEELRPDLVILDVKMPVLDGISAAERIAAQRIAAVVILTAFSQRDLVERARDAGAMAYLVKPFSSADLLPAIEMALSRYAELSALEAEVSDLVERLETRKVVDRAKGVLQLKEGMTEPEAFRWIQRAAMDQRVSMRAVAAALLTDADGQNPPT